MLKSLLKLAVIAITIVILVGLLNMYVGWYSRHLWQNRLGSNSLQESKNRGVFVKQLHFKVNGGNDSLPNFTAYIERAFTCSINSIEDTRPWLNTKYPYQFTFTRNPSQSSIVTISNGDLEKFDSADIFEGYLQTPQLPDTIRLYLDSPHVHWVEIKVW